MLGMRKRLGSKVLKPFLGADENGMALVCLSVMLLAFTGLAISAFNVSRLSIPSPELHSGAASVALATLAEINRTSTVLSFSQAAAGEDLRGGS